MYLNKIALITFLATGCATGVASVTETGTDDRHTDGSSSENALDLDASAARASSETSASLSSSTVEVGKPIDGVSTSPMTISCIVDPYAFPEDPWLIQDGPTCWKYAWINANKALDGTFPSPEKVTEIDKCLTDAGINPAKGLPNTDAAFDKVRACKEEVTEADTPDYDGKEVTFEVFGSWGDFVSSDSDTDDSDRTSDKSGAGFLPAFIGAPETDTSSEGFLEDDGELTDDDRDPEERDPECEESPGDTVGIMVIVTTDSAHALTLTERPVVNEDGTGSFKYVDPNGGPEKTGTIDKNGKIKTGDAYNGWKVSRIELENEEKKGDGC
jgi:hypothetical protein